MNIVSMVNSASSKGRRQSGFNDGFTAPGGRGAGIDLTRPVNDSTAGSVALSGSAGIHPTMESNPHQLMQDRHRFSYYCSTVSPRGDIFP